MKIAIYKDSTLLIPKNIVDEKLLDKYYSITNPKYITAKRFMKRVDPTIPPKILFYQNVDIEGTEFIELPRYSEIDSVIKNRYCDSYEIVDTVKVNSYDTNPTVKFTLREYQKEYMDKHNFDKKTNGVITIQCGGGKTVIAINLICQIKKRAIVFVPTNFLRDQWYQRFEEMTENLSVLSFDDKHNAKEMNFYDVVIITLEMYNARVTKLDSNIFDIVVFDEAHRLGATSYIDITNQLTAKYRFALSATFRRSDGMDSILFKAFGEQYIMPNQFPLPRTVFMDMSQFIVPVTGYYNLEKDKDKAYILETVKHFPNIEVAGEYLLIHNPDDIMEVMYSCGKQKEKSIWQKIYAKTEKSVTDPNYPAIDSIITNLPQLRKTIIRVIDKCLRNGRKPLVISKRVDLLKYLYFIYSDKVTCQIVLGKANGNFDGTKINPENQILFGIAQLASEGLDADFLDTLILCNPSSDIEQAYGRIRRLKEGKKYPTVIQFKGLHASHDKVSNPYNKVFKANSLTPETVYSIREIELK